MPELSYGECLRIGWFLLWRGSVLSFLVFALGAIVLEFVVTVFGPLREYTLVLYVSATLGVVMFGIYMMGEGPGLAITHPPRGSGG
ncbi:MAG: hypothetical protein IH803_10530 [Nitrospirae bacterium]|nr:hypothetical protein [Nitrospirota bacterium]